MFDGGYWRCVRPFEYVRTSITSGRSLITGGQAQARHTTSGLSYGRRRHDRDRSPSGSRRRREFDRAGEAFEDRSLSASSVPRARRRDQADRNFTSAAAAVTPPSKPRGSAEHTPPRAPRFRMRSAKTERVDPELRNLRTTHHGGAINSEDRALVTNGVKPRSKSLSRIVPKLAANDTCIVFLPARLRHWTRVSANCASAASRLLDFGWKASLERQG